LRRVQLQLRLLAHVGVGVGVLRHRLKLFLRGQVLRLGGGQSRFGRLNFGARRPFQGQAWFIERNIFFTNLR
jgi:hypothetical protein